MPKYIDYHETMPAMPPEAIEQVAAAVRAAKPDEYGVRTLNHFMGEGRGFCWTEAPTAEAVVKSHRASGIPQETGNVTEVQSLV